MRRGASRCLLRTVVPDQSADEIALTSAPVSSSSTLVARSVWADDSDQLLAVDVEVGHHLRGVQHRIVLTDAFGATGLTSRALRAIVLLLDLS